MASLHERHEWRGHSVTTGSLGRAMEGNAGRCSVAMQCSYAVCTCSCVSAGRLRGEVSVVFGIPR